MSPRNLFRYPFFHFKQATRLALPRKSFKNIDLKIMMISTMAIGVLIYEIHDIVRHFIVPAKSLERDRFNLLETKAAFQTLILSHQPLSGRQKLQQRSLF